MTGRKLDEIASLSPSQREKVEARYRELKDEAESLGDLRRAAGKAQADIAATLKIKQPSVSKIEKQTDMYLSTLRGYVEAIGGSLDLVVHLPSRAPIRITRLGDMSAADADPPAARPTSRARARRDGSPPPRG